MEIDIMMAELGAKVGMNVISAGGDVVGTVGAINGDSLTTDGGREVGMSDVSMIEPSGVYLEK